MSKLAYSYARYSSDKQSPLSIEQQQAEIQIYAKLHGYVIVKEFSDAAISGKSAAKRPQYQAMRKAVMQGTDDVAAIIIYKLDRLSRNIVDFSNIMQELSYKDIIILSCTENLDCTSAAGRLFTNMKALLSSYYLDNMSEDIMRSMTSDGRLALHNGGKPPLGYYVENRQYHVLEEEAQIVRLVFSLYDQAYTYYEILEQLNIRGFKTRSGKAFSKVGLYDILHRKIYMGTYTWNRMEKRKADGRRSKKSKPAEQIIEIPDAVPAIIDKDMFHRVQQRLQDKSKDSGRGKAREFYLLSGRAYCAECGHKLEGNAKICNGNRYVNYRCSHRHSTGRFGCTAREINRELLDGYVLSLLEQFLLNPSTIPTILDTLNKRLAQDVPDNTEDVRQIQQRLKELEREKSHIINAIAETGLNTVFADKLREINAAIDTANTVLQSEITADEPQHFEVTEDMLVELFRQGRETLNHKTIPALKRLVETYVERVEVDKETVTATLKVAFVTDEGAVDCYRFATPIPRSELQKSA